VIILPFTLICRSPKYVFFHYCISVSTLMAQLDGSGAKELRDWESLDRHGSPRNTTTSMMSRELVQQICLAAASKIFAQR